MKHALAMAAATAFAVTPQASAAMSAPSVAAVQQFGKCAAAHYDGAELLATQPGSEEEADVLSEFARRSCAPASNDAALLRGAVAEQLFKSDFGVVGGRPKREHFEIFTLAEGDLDSLDDSAKHRFDVVAFGTCVALSNPEKVGEMLGSPPESAAEGTAFAALQPAFSPCLKQGETMTASKAQLRGAFAEGAYRMSVSTALNSEVVVTGTKEDGRKVVCRVRPSAGSLFGQKLCLSGDAWKARQRDEEIAAHAIALRIQEWAEREETMAKNLERAQLNGAN